jgi:copper chaperone CopZ
MHKPYLAAMLCLAMLPIAGCAPNRKGAAQSIEDAVAQLPGVASSDVDYDAGWPKGDERFTLTAVLRDSATPDQAQAVGKTFADLVKANDFAASDVALEVKYRVVDRINRVPQTSSATVSLDRGNGDGLPAALKEWLSIAQSPGVQSARVSRPEGTVEITVDRDATDGDLPALAKTYPDLDRAQWVLTGGNLTQTKPFAGDYPEVYRVQGMIPDAALREVWKQIVAEVGAAGEVGAQTDMSRKDIPTTVDVNFPTSRDREQDLAQAWMVLPLLQKLPQQAKVDFGGALFVIGGCTPGEAGRSTDQLEVELRQKYEKC